MSVKRKVTVPVGRSLTTQGFRVLVTGANRNLDPAGPVDPVLDEYRPPPCGGAGPQFPSRQQKEQPFAASSWFQVSPLTDSNRRPPPYHGTSHATGGSRWQRIWPVSAASATCRFADDCHRL